MKTRLLAVLVLGAGLLGSAPAHGQDLSGSGEWQSRSGVGMRGTWTAALTRSNSDLSGTIALTGSTLLSGGTVNGKIDGDVVTFGVVSDDTEQVRFTGKLANGAVSGDWECDAIDDRGTWRGTLGDGSGGS